MAATPPARKLIEINKRQTTGTNENDKPLRILELMQLNGRLEGT